MLQPSHSGSLSPEPLPIESRIKQDISDFKEQQRQRVAQEARAERQQKKQVRRGAVSPADLISGLLSHPAARVEPAGTGVGSEADRRGPEEPAGEDAGLHSRDVSSRPSGPEARRQSSDQCGQQLHPHGEVEALGW